LYEKEPGKSTWDPLMFFINEKTFVKIYAAARSPERSIPGASVVRKH
jgi:hypothetical protein